MKLFFEIHKMLKNKNYRQHVVRELKQGMKSSKLNKAAIILGIIILAVSTLIILDCSLSIIVGLFLTLTGQGSLLLLVQMLLDVLIDFMSLSYLIPNTMHNMSTKNLKHSHFFDIAKEKNDVKYLKYAQDDNKDNEKLLDGVSPHELDKNVRRDTEAKYFMQAIKKERAKAKEPEDK